MARPALSARRTVRQRVAVMLQQTAPRAWHYTTIARRLRLSPVQVHTACLVLALQGRCQWVGAGMYAVLPRGTRRTP